MRISLGLMGSFIGFFFCVSQSHAQFMASEIIVIGNGPGQECYLATKTDFGPQGNRDALQNCNEAVDDHSVSRRDRAAAYINRAFIELRFADYASVLADSDQGIELMPTLGEGYLNRGAALIGLQRYDEAAEAINKSLETGLASDQLAYFDRGVAEEFLHDVRGAYYDYKKAVEIDPRFQLASDQLTRFTVIPAQKTQ